MIHHLLARQIADCTDAGGRLDLDRLTSTVSAAYARHDAEQAESERLITRLVADLESHHGDLVAEVHRQTEEAALLRSTLQATFENMSQGIVMVDADLRIQVYNRKLLDLLDLPESLLEGGAHVDTVLQYQRETGEFTHCEDDFKSQASSGQFDYGPQHYVRQRPNGRWIDIRTTPLQDGGFVRTYSEVTELKLQERALIAKEAEYRSLFENALVGIYRSTVDGRQIRANPALVRLNGYATETELLVNITDIEKEWYVKPGRRAEFKELMERDGRVTDFVSQVHRHKTREKIWVSENAWTIRNPDGSTAYYEGTVVEATERIVAERKIAHLALCDQLTGLPNRARFTQELELAVAQTQREGAPCVVFIDLDRFKEVNDTLGHQAGDQLLKAAAQRLKRETGRTPLVARLGGDEFAILIRRASDLVRVEALAQRIIASLSKPVLIAEQPVVVGASAGIAFGSPGLSAEELSRRADIALYRAKGEGKGAACVFNDNMGLELAARRALENDLRQALAEDGLDVHYQPIQMLPTGQTVGYEALVRWNHPVNGWIAPAEFIPVAEQCGLIGAVGEWVLARAVADIARISGSHWVSVNLSATQFRTRGLVASVREALRATELDPSRLLLEVTETLLMMDDAVTLGALHDLRQLGVSIALDDFGTGFSSLSYLHRFRFDKIKLDRSFVARVESDVAARAVIKAAVSMASDLGMQVVAEGIETAAQLRELIGFGCSHGQGFLLGRPRPIGAIERAPSKAVAGTIAA